VSIYALDLIGVFAFAFFGANSAVQSQLHIVWAALCGFLTALGGGTIRQAILQHEPTYFKDPLYGLAVLSAVLVASLGKRHFHHLRAPMLVLDAVGLAVFAYLGTSAADRAGLGPEVMFGFAMLTAVGGGIISDLLIIQRRPQILVEKVYVVPVLAFVAAYWAFQDYVHRPLVIPALIIGAFSLRFGTLLQQQWRELKMAH